MKYGLWSLVFGLSVRVIRDLSRPKAENQRPKAKGPIPITKKDNSYVITTTSN